MPRSEAERIRPELEWIQGPEPREMTTRCWVRGFEPFVRRLEL